MTREELLKDLELSEKATPGPWTCSYLDEYTYATWIEPQINTGNGYEGQIKVNDAKFIAASRTRWPQTIRALIIAIEALEYYSQYVHAPHPEMNHLGVAQNALKKIEELSHG